VIVAVTPTREHVSSALTPLAAADRLPVFLALLKDAPPEIFVPLFYEWFSRCENTLAHRRSLIRRLREAAQPRTYMNDAARALFDNLAYFETVYRGCPSNRINGISWSLSFKAADGFARFHRAIARSGRVYDALIPKHAILAVLTDQDESTIIIDPTCLVGVHIIGEEAPAFGVDVELARLEAPKPDRTRSLEPSKTDHDALVIMSRGARAKLPPIANMTTANLKAMLARAEQSLQFEQHPYEISQLKDDRRRARAELADRKKGAKPGRMAPPGATLDRSSVGQPRRKLSPGRPRDAARHISLRRPRREAA